MQLFAARLAEYDSAQSLLGALKVKADIALKKYTYLPSHATETEKASVLVNHRASSQRVTNQAALISDALNAYTQSKAAY